MFYESLHIKIVVMDLNMKCDKVQVSLFYIYIMIIWKNSLEACC